MSRYFVDDPSRQTYARVPYEQGVQGLPDHGQGDHVDGHLDAGVGRHRVS